MSVAKNLAECRSQYKEKEAIFDNEVRDLRNQISNYVREIEQKFMQFKNDLLGRLCTDDFLLYNEMGRRRR